MIVGGVLLRQRKLFALRILHQDQGKIILAEIHCNPYGKIPWKSSGSPRGNVLGEPAGGNTLGESADLQIHVSKWIFWTSSLICGRSKMSSLIGLICFKDPQDPR